MARGTPERPETQPNQPGSSYFGYDSAAVQEHYIASEASLVADLFLPHLQSGMSLLDCGCGPGTITVGLAEATAPGEVVGIDLEPSMIERANAFASERQVANVRFQVADIHDLPFPDGSFDAAYSSAVLEHSANPVQALQEIFRVLKLGGLIGVTSTDWAEPLVSPVEEAVGQFFALMGRGYNHYGGSLNRGRHLTSMLSQAGFRVTEFLARYDNEGVRDAVEEYVQYIENWSLFDQAVELGWVDRPALEKIKDRMRQWCLHPDAILAIGTCVAIGQKKLNS